MQGPMAGIVASFQRIAIGVGLLVSAALEREFGCRTFESPIIEQMIGANGQLMGV
jgi:hypothetical protein